MSKIKNRQRSYEKEHCLFFYKNFLVKREDRTQYSFMRCKYLDDVPSTLYNSHASFVLLYHNPEMHG